MSFRYSIAGIFLALLITGCSGSQSGTPLSPALQTRVKPAPPLVKSGALAIWAVDQVSNAIYGLTSDAGTIVSTIDTNVNECFMPSGLKVDHRHNLWVGCFQSAEYSEFPLGSVQEYSRAGKLRAAYEEGCPSNPPPGGCERIIEDGNYLDVAASDAEVFALNPSLAIGSDCNGNYCQNWTVGPMIEFWAKSHPGSQPGLINLVGASFGGIQYVNIYAFDVDGSGNLWVSFSGSTSEYAGGYGVMEIENPAGPSPTFVLRVPLAPDSLMAVYISNDGTVLNVLDRDTDEIDRYHMTPSFEPTPFQVLGPLPAEGSQGPPMPLSFGFRTGDKQVVVGNWKWIDLGKVNKNRWRASPYEGLGYGIVAAAYAHSDK